MGLLVDPGSRVDRISLDEDPADSLEAAVPALGSPLVELGHGEVYDGTVEVAQYEVLLLRDEPFKANLDAVLSAVRENTDAQLGFQEVRAARRKLSEKAQRANQGSEVALKALKVSAPGESLAGAEVVFWKKRHRQDLWVGGYLLPNGRTRILTWAPKASRVIPAEETGPSNMPTPASFTASSDTERRVLSLMRKHARYERHAKIEEATRASTPYSR